jgi:hypothetical protein
MTWLIVLVFAALALTAAIYGGIAWLVRYIDRPQPCGAVIHVEATALPPTRSYQPLPNRLQVHGTPRRELPGTVLSSRQELEGPQRADSHE